MGVIFPSQFDPRYVDAFQTDAEREWAYDRTFSIGRLDKALDEAQAKRWTVADMKNDWKIIYPFEKR